LSIFARELIPIILLIYIVFTPVQKRRFKFLTVLAISLVTFIAMIEYSEIPSFYHGRDLNYIINLFLSFSLDKQFLKQAILSNNLPIFAVLLIISMGVKNLKPFIPYAVISVALFIISIASGIGNNTGRILNLGIPFLIIGIAEITCHLNLSKRQISEEK